MCVSIWTVVPFRCLFVLPSIPAQVCALAQARRWVYSQQHLVLHAHHSNTRAQFSLIQWSPPRRMPLAPFRLAALANNYGVTTSVPLGYNDFRVAALAPTPAVHMA